MFFSHLENDFVTFSGESVGSLKPYVPTANGESLVELEKSENLPQKRS